MPATDLQRQWIEDHYEELEELYHSHLAVGRQLFGFAYSPGIAGFLKFVFEYHGAKQL